MTSSLYGIYNAQRSLLLNQAAINLINNNIANINTPGYSKQRLELSQNINANPNANIPLIASQSGTGATIDAITRNRDIYLDTYLRKETTTLNYYKELNDSATLIEDIANELGDSGISTSLNEFYAAAQQLSLNPTDSIARNNLIQKALDVCGKFNITADRITDLRTNLVGDIADPATLETSKINVSSDYLNVQLAAIADLNQTISLSTSQGMTPNGLLDERDKLLDKIAEYIPITVTHGANNLVSISINGTDIVKGKDQVGFFDVVVGDVLNPATVRILDETGAVVVANANALLTSGKMGAILEMGGSDPNKLNIYNFVQNLDSLAREFAREVNTIQRGGQYIDTSVTPQVLTPVTVAVPPPDPFDVFVELAGATQANYGNLTAGNIRINQDVIDDVYKIAAARATSAPNETGDGNNSLLLGQLRDKKIAALGNTETEAYLNSLVGKLGIQVKSIQENYDSQNTIVQQVETRRDSVTGVNMDEELTDLVRFQRAFEASARMFNVMDTIMQQIINLAK